MHKRQFPVYSPAPVPSYLFHSVEGRGGSWSQEQRSAETEEISQTLLEFALKYREKNSRAVCQEVLDYQGRDV